MTYRSRSLDLSHVLRTCFPLLWIPKRRPWVAENRTLSPTYSSKGLLLSDVYLGHPRSPLQAAEGAMVQGKQRLREL